MLKGCQDYKPVGPITFVINYDKAVQAATWPIQHRHQDSFPPLQSPLFTAPAILSQGNSPLGDDCHLVYIYITAADSDNQETITSFLTALGTWQHQGAWPSTRNKHTAMDCILQEQDTFLMFLRVSDLHHKDFLQSSEKLTDIQIVRNRQRFKDKQKYILRSLMTFI